MDSGPPAAVLPSAVPPLLFTLHNNHGNNLTELPLVRSYAFSRETGAPSGVDSHLVGLPADAAAGRGVFEFRRGAPDGDRQAADRPLLPRRQDGASAREGDCGLWTHGTRKPRA